LKVVFGNEKGREDSMAWLIRDVDEVKRDSERIVGGEPA
jgi:hypothetical protein